MRPIVKGIGTLALFSLLALACADTSAGGQNVRVVKNPEDRFGKGRHLAGQAG